SVAIELVARIAVHPGTVVSIERSGSLTQVTFGHGALVLVASDGRIASVIAPTSLVPVG
ncbi:MAG: hypothetical protein HZB15_10195, partial [Actinobacteria bacterium]|nr:hypothetical protein [Actinomycetota bacterium]